MKKHLIIFLICIISVLLLSSCSSLGDNNDNSVSSTPVPEQTLGEGEVCDLHVFGEWSIKEEPTCRETGLKTRKCTICSTEMSEKLEKTSSHEYDSTGTCSVCNKLNIPVIYLKGSLDGISKQNTVKVSLSYKDDDMEFNSYATLRVQGASSQFYDKKNFHLKLYEDKQCTDKYKVDFGWGEESKYCLKANYIDFSQARNIVSGRLYSQIVHSRTPENEILNALPNGGVVDGFPVLIYLNGQFHGLYTLNIPKDEWMMGLEGQNPHQAIISANDWTDSCALKQTMRYDFSGGWELEYSSTENTTWIPTSFNRMINFINQNNGERFKAGIDKYVDVEATMDYMIFMYFMRARDNSSKNIIWVTYDGERWMPNMYDMDGTYGIHWNGLEFFPTDDRIPVLKSNGTVDPKIISDNILFRRIFENYREELCERYFELRESILSMENIEKEFDAFFALIPDRAYVMDKTKWKDLPSNTVNHRIQILTYTEERLVHLDAFFNQLQATVN